MLMVGRIFTKCIGLGASYMGSDKKASCEKKQITATKRMSASRKELDGGGGKGATKRHVPDKHQIMNAVVDALK